MTIIVTGTRRDVDRDKVVRLVQGARRPEYERVVCGDCPTGVDLAVRMGLHLEGDAIYAADWGKHGLGAGPLRNTHMLRTELGLGPVRLVMAFWDGKIAKSGTLDCMRQANSLGLRIIVYPYSLYMPGASA